MMHARQRAAFWLVPVAACLYAAAAWAFECNTPDDTEYQLTLIESDDADWSDSAKALVDETDISLWDYSESDPQREMSAHHE